MLHINVSRGCKLIFFLTSLLYVTRRPTIYVDCDVCFRMKMLVVTHRYVVRTFSNCSVILIVLSNKKTA